jgi:hypothetical protein
MRRTSEAMADTIILRIEALLEYAKPSELKGNAFLQKHPIALHYSSKAGPNLDGSEWEGGCTGYATRQEAYQFLQEYEEKKKKELEARYKRPVEVKRNTHDYAQEKEEMRMKKTKGDVLEFKVLGQLKTEGEKTNSKGEVVDVDITGFSLMEQKPKGSTGVPIKIQIRCEGTHLPDFMVGDLIEFKKKTSQTKLTGQQPAKPEQKPEAKPAAKKPAAKKKD